MPEHPNHDNSHFYHDGDSVRSCTYAVHSSGQDADASAHGRKSATPPPLNAPHRFAIYVDTEETEDMPDKDLYANEAFDPANVMAWGLEDGDAAMAYRSNGGERVEQFRSGSAARVRALLELAGYGPLRVLYL